MTESDWKPPLSSVPDDASNGVVYVTEDPPVSWPADMQVGHEVSFDAHWEGTVEGQRRFSTVRSFDDVDDAVAWGREHASVVYVRLIVEGHWEVFSAGSAHPDPTLAKWSSRS